jgi:hypothetical protein
LAVRKPSAAKAACPNDGMERATKQFAHLSENQPMSHMTSKSPPVPDLRPFDEEGSAIRSRDDEDGDEVRSARTSSPELKAHSGPPHKRSHSSTRPATGSLDDRLEKKLQLASMLTRDLAPSDSRVRLLQVAVMRRDEALLDGVMAELNKPPRRA